jgi:flavodoxin
MKTLVVYYSLTGNTEKIARRIADALGADLEKIEVAQPYEGSYQQIVSLAEGEVNRNYQRPIKPLKNKVADYDRIIVGTPTWWYKMASPVLTFLSNNNFAGKTIVPYMTNAGWPGTVIDDMTSLARRQGAKVGNGHEFLFNTNANGYTSGMTTPKRVLEHWIDMLR